MTISTIKQELPHYIHIITQKFSVSLIPIILAYLGSWEPLEGLKPYDALIAPIHRYLLTDYQRQHIPLSDAEKMAIKTSLLTEAAPPFNEIILNIESAHQLPQVPQEEKFNLIHRFDLAKKRQTFILRLQQGVAFTLPKQWMDDEHVLLAAAQISLTYLSEFSATLFSNRALMQQLVTLNGMALGKVNPSLRDETLSKIAVSECGAAIQFVPLNTPNYEEIALSAIAQDAYAINLLPRSLSRNSIFQQKALLANSRVADHL